MTSNNLIVLVVLTTLLVSCKEDAKPLKQEGKESATRFEVAKDFLLLNFDCKTD